MVDKVWVWSVVSLTVGVESGITEKLVHSPYVPFVRIISSTAEEWVGSQFRLFSFLLFGGNGQFGDKK